VALGYSPSNGFEPLWNQYNEMKINFFEQLYKGYSAEHFVCGQLSQMGFEVFRMPADFGLDLVVTNKFHNVTGNNKYNQMFPFGLQVKSRWLKKQQVGKGPNGRPEVRVDFILTAEELNLLLEHQTTAIAFVTFMERTVFKFFWVSSLNLKALYEKGFLRVENKKLILSVKYLERPRVTRDQFLSEFKTKFQNSESMVKYLEKHLPEKFYRNWNAEKYMRFARMGRDGVTQEVFKSVWDVSEDLSDFPDQKSVGGLD
jgi:hypothetical protein